MMMERSGCDGGKEEQIKKTAAAAATVFVVVPGSDANANNHHHHQHHQQQQQHLPLFLQLSCWACSLGGLLFGYGTSIISDALHFMSVDLGLDEWNQGVLTSSLLIGAALGALVCGRISDMIGRRRAMLGLCLLFLLGCLSASLAPNFMMLLPARVLNGFSIGGFSAVVPIWLAELSPASIRAQMVTRNTLLIVGGQLLVFVVGAVLGFIWSERMDIWRWMNGLALVPGVVLLLCSLFLLPESPRWLVSVGQPSQALAILRRVRSSPIEAEAELELISIAVQEQQKCANNGGGHHLLVFLSQRWLRNCALLGLGIAFSQQAIGTVVPMYYGTNILERMGMEMKLAMVVNVSIGIVSVLAMSTGLWLAGRVNRRPMLLAGFLGCAVAHLLSALCAWLLPDGNTKGLAVLVLLLLFCVFMQGSVSTTTWFMLAEIFPLHVRGIIMGVCTVAIWLTKFTHGLLLPLVMDSVGIPLTFLILLCFCLLSVLFVWLFLPETRGKTLEQLEEQFKTENWTALKEGPKNNENKLKIQRQQWSNDASSGGSTAPSVIAKF